MHALGGRAEPRIAGDVFVAGTHKWLGGPRGTGPDLDARLGARSRPTIPSFDASDEPGPRFTPGGWHSFEHRWALARPSRPRAGDAPQRIAALATRLKDGLAELPHVRLITPRDPAVSRRASSASRSTGWTPRRRSSRLLGAPDPRLGDAVRGQQYARLGTSLHVDAADVDAAVGSVKALQG